MNERGEMVGASFGAAGPNKGHPRAFLWRNGMMTDLNDLIPANASLHLLIAFGINDAGEIVGFGVTNPGDLHAFLATPCTADKSRTGHSAVGAHSTAECFRETQRSANTKSTWASESDRETETRLSTEESARGK